MNKIIFSGSGSVLFYFPLLSFDTFWTYWLLHWFFLWNLYIFCVLYCHYTCWHYVYQKDTIEVLASNRAVPDYISSGPSTTLVVQTVPSRSEEENLQQHWSYRRYNQRIKKKTTEMFDKGQVSRLWSESNFESISVWLFPLFLISKFYQNTVA